MKSINGKKRVLLSLLGMALSLVFVPLTKNIWILYILLVLYDSKSEHSIYNPKRFRWR